MSRRILVFCEGIWLAHTARPLAVARGLREAGWEVHFGASGKFTKLLESDGFPVQPVATMNPDEALAAIRSTRIGYNRRVVEEYVEDELTLLRRIRPDAVLNDFRLPVAISARLAGVPFANILNAYWTNYYAPERRAPEDFPLTRVLGKKRATRILPTAMKLVTAFYARPFNSIAGAHAMAKFGNIFDVMDSPDLNLVCDLEEFMPLKGAPVRFRTIGPILWEPSVPPPEWLARVEPGRPTIYFSMGSTGYGKYHDWMKKAFSGTDFQVLVTTGGSAGAEDMPDNFFVAEMAPALALIERSSLVICHGGNGTIYQALAKGVPVLGIPTFHDQDFNMQRVEDLGVGAVLYPQRVTAQALRETAERLIADERAHATARELAARIAATDAVGDAVRHIERLGAA